MAERRSQSARCRRRKARSSRACPGGRSRPRSLGVLELFVPRHLNRLEFRFVRRLGIVVETLERQHALAEIREAEGQRIDAREFLREGNADVFGLRPLHGVTSCAFRSFLSDLPSWMPPPSCT